MLHCCLLKECLWAGCALMHWELRAGAFQCALCGPDPYLGVWASPGPGPSLLAQDAAGTPAASCIKKNWGMLSVTRFEKLP